MKYLPLLWAGLWRKPLRTTLTVLSLVAAFTLFGVLQGIDAGFTRLVEVSSMDRISVFGRFAGVQMPISYREKIASLPGVTIVTAVANFGGYIQDPKKFFYIATVDENYFAVYPKLSLTKDQIELLKQTRTGFLASPALVNRLGLKVGDKVPVTGYVPKRDGSTAWSLELMGLVDRVDNPNTYQFGIGNYEYYNAERIAGTDTANIFILRLSDPEQAVPTARAIDAMFANSGAPTRSQVERLALEADLANFGDVKLFVNAIVVAVLFSLLLLTANVMMQSYRERTPELAVLKTLGFQDSRVLLLVLAESLTQCLLGAAIGLGLAWAVVPFMKGKLPGPSFVLEMPLRVAAIGLVVAIIVAVLSAALPAWRAGRMQIVDALAGR